MKNKRIAKIIFGFFFLTFVLMTPASQNLFAEHSVDAIKLEDFFDSELAPGKYFTVKDERNGKIVTKTSRYVHVGDEVITSNNSHFRVAKVKGTIAYAKFLGIDKTIAWKPNDEENKVAPTADLSIPTQGNQGKGSNKIAIYHTHSDESYVPTDGSESVPNKGGIFKVGTVFAKQLEKMGVDAVLSLRPHEPHDANAYHRSRRTAVQLLKQQPVALIDVHRDGVPDPDFYTGEVKEAPQSATAIRLVVGRQNAHMQANLEFAKKIKAYMDQEKPGLIKEIFMAKGNYNQDLAPRAILIEAGTHTNKREQAQHGVAIFAEALPKMLGIQNGTAPAPGPQGQGPAQPSPGASDSPASWSSLWIILAVVLIGGAGFLLISTGSIKGSTDKLGQFFSKEWANALGVRKEEKKQVSGSDYEKMRNKVHELRNEKNLCDKENGSDNEK